MKPWPAQAKWLYGALMGACWSLLFFNVTVAIPISLVLVLVCSRKSREQPKLPVSIAPITPEEIAVPEPTPRNLRMIYDKKGFSVETQGHGDYHPAKNDEVAAYFSQHGFQAEDVQKIFFHLLGCLGAQSLQWRLIRNDIPRESSPSNGVGPTYQLAIAPRLDKAGKIDRFDISFNQQAAKENPEKKVAAQGQVVDLKNYLDRDMIFALIRIPESVFRNFTEETMRLTQMARTEIKKLGQMSPAELALATETMFRYVHTIKANARAFKLKDIHTSAHNVEQTITTIQQQHAAKTTEIKELLRHFMAMTDAVYAVTDLRRELTEQASPDQSFVASYRLQWIRSLMRRFSEAFRNPRLNFRDLERILRELDKALSSFDTTSLFEYLQSYDSLIQNLSTQLQKRAQRIAYSGIDAQFKRPVILKLNDVILHCLRNAVDHGIESPEQRVSAGKRPDGLITITCNTVNGKTTLTISDDGCGMSREKIAAQAQKMELVTAEQIAAMSDEDVFLLICRPGFSTKVDQSDVSGRGVGMDVVHSVILGMRGSIEISSKLGAGTKISLSFREDQESYQPSFKMVDVNRIFRDIYNRVATVLAARNQQIIWPTVDRQYFVFAEQHALESLINNFLFLLLSLIDKGSVVKVAIFSHQGKRRMDSHEFYRLVFDIVKHDGERILLKADALDNLKEYCQPLDAVVRLSQDQLLEFNIPANLPPRYHDIKLRFAISQQFLTTCQPYVESYMNQYLQGFVHEVSAVNPNIEASEDIKLWILAHGEVSQVLDARQRNGRFEDEDFLIVIPHGQSPLRNALTEKWGEKLLYINDQFTPEQFMQSIEAIISRQLAARMMQEQPPNQEARRAS